MKRFFAQFFGLRFICPKCHDLNTYRRGRSRGTGPSSFNRIAGQVQCSRCHKVYCIGVLLYDVVPAGGKGGHPDQTPTLKELQLIRQDQEDYESEHQGRRVEVRKKRSDPINFYADHNPTDEEVKNR